MEKMKFDLYFGTENDMNESGGQLIRDKQSRLDLTKFCNKQNISLTALMDGNYMPCNKHYGY